MLCRHLLIEVMKGYRRDSEHGSRGRCLHRCHAWQSVEDATFTEEVFRNKSGKRDLVGFPIILEETDTSASNDKELVAGFTFTSDHGIFLKFSFFRMLKKQAQGVILQPGKDRNSL